MYCARAHILFDIITFFEREESIYRSIDLSHAPSSARLPTGTIERPSDHCYVFRRVVMAQPIQGVEFAA